LEGIYQFRWSPERGLKKDGKADWESLMLLSPPLRRLQHLRKPHCLLQGLLASTRLDKILCSLL